MAQQLPNPSSNIPYDPLDSHPPHPLHDFASPPSTPRQHEVILDDPRAQNPALPLPPGAGHPFYGSQFGRDSYASSHNQFPTSSSVGLDYNEPGSALRGPTDSARLHAEQGVPLMPYRDYPDNASMADSGIRPYPASHPMSYLGPGVSRTGSFGPTGGYSQASSTADLRLALPAHEKSRMYTAPARTNSRRKCILITAIIVALLLLAVAIVIPLYFAVIRPRLNNSESNNSSESPSRPNPTGSSRPVPTTVVAITGGDGSVITTESGTEFTYRNQLGGYWVFDRNDPFNNGAKAQSYTPALNETFDYGRNRIRGVNLGGWLNLEPFISPEIFQRYPGAEDEYQLSLAMAADTANGGLNQIEEHYKTFITEEDIARIAGAGLNFVRIPIPFWAVDTLPNEPYLPKVAWNYFLKSIEWCRKYGIRINLDLHTLPGSQNGWNHSGHLGQINWLQGVMGLANGQRSLDIIRVIAQFITQPQYKDVIVMFGIANEPRIESQAALSSWYREVYEIIREIGGTGAGNGPIISLHDGFFRFDSWFTFLPGADRLALDTHPYFAFGGQSPDGPEAFITRPCTGWTSDFTGSMQQFGLASAGEWSLAINDCGLYLNGVDQGMRYEGTFIFESTPRIGSCDEWTNYRAWTPERKQNYYQFALHSMDASQNYFFWTWKIGPAANGEVMTPAWSYSLGLEQGWMPADPREADGACGSGTFTGTLPPNAVGLNVGPLPPTAAQQHPWPPAEFNPALLPTYTQTGAIPTLPVPTYTNDDGESIDAGNGWHEASDTTPVYVPVGGCSYPDQYSAVGIPTPPPCSGGAVRRFVPPSHEPTPAPLR